jgi:hypothetical protein
MISFTGETMNNTTEEKEKFAKVMWGLAEECGGKISTDGLKMRFAALKEHSLEQITQAATWLVMHREATFPAVPRTKEIIDAIENLKGPKVSVKTQAEIQADKVLAKLRYHGRAGVADFEDPATQHLMTTRWPYKQWASFVKDDELKWWKKDFLAAYEAYQEAESKQYLPGRDLIQVANGCVKRIEG